MALVVVAAPLRLPGAHRQEGPGFLRPLSMAFDAASARLTLVMDKLAAFEDGASSSLVESSGWSQEGYAVGVKWAPRGSNQSPLGLVGPVLSREIRPLSIGIRCRLRPLDLGHG